MDNTLRIDLGGCSARLVSGGGLGLDGGAMFGIIPKPLWSRFTPADDANRIRLACNCLLVEFDGTDRRVLIETGHGPKYAEKEQKMFQIDPQRWVLPGLTSLGVDPASIMDVVLTHLHFDHAGGLTHTPSDATVLTFPHARVHVQRREFQDARANFGVMTNTYREENFAPLDAADAWRLVDGDTEICAAQSGASIHVRHSIGHTRGHQSVLVRGRDRTLLYIGDVLPTQAHVGRPYNMAYDLLPLDNMLTKQRLLAQAVAEDWLILIGHEPARPLQRCVSAGAWYGLAEA